jgi:hypothetical protein
MSAFVPPQFSKFGKAVSDLLNKRFDYNNQVATKHKADKGITVEAGGVTNAKGAFTGFTKVNYKNKDFGALDLEVHTAGKSSDQKGKATLSNLYKGVEVVLSGDAAQAGKAEVSYAQDFYAVNLTLNSNCKKNKNITYSGSIGSDGLSVGATASTDFTGSVVDYNVGAEYGASDATLTLYTTNRGEEINAAFHHKISSAYSIATHFSHNPASDAKALTVGVDHQFDAITNLKAKIASSGILSSSVEHRLPAGPLLGLAGEFDTLSKTPFSATKFGLYLKFGEY